MSKLGMSLPWYVNTFVCHYLDMSKPWYVTTLICPNLGMSIPWYVQTLVCPLPPNRSTLFQPLLSTLMYWSTVQYFATRLNYVNCRYHDSKANAGLKSQPIVSRLPSAAKYNDEKLNKLSFSLIFIYDRCFRLQEYNLLGLRNSKRNILSYIYLKIM